MIEQLGSSEIVILVQFNLQINGAFSSQNSKNEKRKMKKKIKQNEKKIKQNEKKNKIK